MIQQTRVEVCQFNDSCSGFVGKGQYVVNDLNNWHGNTETEKFCIGRYDETFKLLISDVFNPEEPIQDTTLV